LVLSYLWKSKSYNKYVAIIQTGIQQKKLHTNLIPIGPVVSEKKIKMWKLCVMRTKFDIYILLQTMKKRWTSTTDAKWWQYLVWPFGSEEVKNYYVCVLQNLFDVRTFSHHLYRITSSRLVDKMLHLLKILKYHGE
jgi:hypothetical protein